MDIAETTYPRKTAVSPVSSFDLARSHAIEGEELVQRGFSLAYFIFPDRTVALRILTSALNKLKCKTRQERKRAYWRDKFLKNHITHVTRDEGDTLQWLIYCESEPHEKAEEALGRSSVEDMVVRYVKTLVLLSTRMSSFYVNIAIHRLLYSYTTSETQKLYELITDHYRGADEYRRAKALLMLRLESRFGGQVRSTKADRGEMKYELAEDQGMWGEVVFQCRQMFMPWSTQGKCPFKRQSGIAPDRLLEAVKGNCEKRSNQDKIEINRCHTFIDPVCCSYVVQELGFEDHRSKLRVPRFYMDADRNLRPPSSRVADGGLTSQEQQAIADVLSTEEARRKNVIPRELRFLVDGIEHARLNVEESRELRFQASDAAQLLEIWTEDESGPLLLATHIMTDGDTPHIEARFAAPLKGGRSVTVVLRKAPDEANPWQVFVLVEDAHHAPMALSIRNWLAYPPAFPAFASLAVLFVAVLVLSTSLWRSLERERGRNNQLDAELAHERVAQTSSHPSEMQTTVKYRLTPDELRTRSNDIEDHAVAVPSVPTVIELVLPVTEIHGRYRCVLTTLEGDNRILVEEGLSADTREAEASVTCSVPSDLLASDRYYRVELLDKAFHSVRTFTFYTVAARR